jgi:hypothetical protein
MPDTCGENVGSPSRSRSALAFSMNSRAGAPAVKNSRRFKGGSLFLFGRLARAEGEEQAAHPVIGNKSKPRHLRRLVKAVEINGIDI